MQYAAFHFLLAHTRRHDLFDLEVLTRGVVQEATPGLTILILTLADAAKLAIYPCPRTALKYSRHHDAGAGPA